MNLLRDVKVKHVVLLGSWGLVFTASAVKKFLIKNKDRAM